MAIRRRSLLYSLGFLLLSVGPAHGQTAPCSPVPGGTGTICILTFDVLPDGRAPVPFSTVVREQFRALTGVSFPMGAWVLRPRNGTKSGEFALINASLGDDLEFNRQPLPIELAAGLGVRRVKLHYGVDRSVPAVRAKLTAFDAAGAVLAAVEAPTIDGPTAVDRPLELAIPAGGSVRRLEFLLTGDTPTAQYLVELVDDLEIETEAPPACPPETDHDGPLVSITDLPAGTSWFTQNVDLLSGSIHETSGKLSNVVVEVEGPGGRYSIDLTHQLSAAPGAADFAFAVGNVGLFIGLNQITLRADDDACPPNHGETSISLTVVSPPSGLNLYVMAVEITQGIQDRLLTRAVTREGGDPRLFRPLTYDPAAIPLVAGKRTLVRVYPGIIGTTVPITPIPATLTIRRGDTTRTLRAAPIAVDPADQVLMAAGTLDFARTLERRRADLAKTWDFVLPASATEAGKIDSLEVRINPHELSGPSECSACNDLANSLTIANIGFQPTAALQVRSFYVKGDGAGAGADVQTFCGAFLSLYPVKDGCGTGRADTNDLPVGIGLLGLTAETRLDAAGNPDLGSAGWQDTMCKRMVSEKDTFPPPAAYVALGPGGLGGPPGNGIGPAACAATDFPGFFTEYRYGVAAQELGHGFLGPWHACPGPPGGWPKYANANGDEYFPGSIGQFGVDTQRLALKDPARVSDFMGYTYCDRWTTDSGGDEAPDRMIVRAFQAIRIGEGVPLAVETNLLAQPVGGSVSARGLSFKLETLNPATSARPAEATVLVSGTATAGDLFVQVDGRPPLGIPVTAGPTVRAVRDAIAGPGGLNDQTGVDSRDRELFSLESWVSPYTYRLLFDQFKGALKQGKTEGRTGDPALKRSPRSPFLVVSGKIVRRTRATFLPFYQLREGAGPGRGSRSGRYLLELRDGEDRILFARRFEPNPAHADSPNVRRFFLTTPFPARTARIVLKLGDRILATQKVSANRPSVTLIEPNGGEVWGADETRLIEWTVADPDRGKLFADVQYSVDGGAAWHSLASNVEGNQLNVETSLLPGSDRAMVRVLVSDGVNTGVDSSDAPFRVARKEPVVFLTGARDDAILTAGSILNLQANVIDPNGEGFAEEQLVWSSDRVGVLGHGGRLELSAEDLGPGPHLITFEVQRPPLPPLTRSLRILRPLTP